MRRACSCVVVLSLAGLWAGCGGAPSTTPSTSESVAATSGGETSDPRIDELEARIAVQSAEVRALRSELAEARARGESVRIGGAAERSPDGEAAPDFTTLAGGDDEEPAPSSGPSRPVLRLYGAPPPPSSVAVLAGPPAPSLLEAPPEGALARLPVVLTPGAPDSVPAIPLSPVAVAAPTPAPSATPAVEPAVAEYRAALAYVSARQWDLALAALGRFVTEHPDHAYADNAMYWRGEVLYARRDYAAAITELSAMIARFPQGNKVPDALLRIGFAYQRLGESERAREIFRRVREQYPGTVAARSAPWEDA